MVPGHLARALHPEDICAGAWVHPPGDALQAHGPEDHQAQGPGREHAWGTAMLSSGLVAAKMDMARVDRRRQLPVWQPVASPSV